MFNLIKQEFLQTKKDTLLNIYCKKDRFMLFVKEYLIMHFYAKYFGKITLDVKSQYMPFVYRFMSYHMLTTLMSNVNIIPVIS